MKHLFNICLCACALALASCVGDGRVKDESNNSQLGDKGILVLNVGTRTANGAHCDYILSIYKNEGDKSMLVRKYDSSKADMQKPEYIWLLEGNYTTKVESGTAKAATFNKAEQYFIGESDFVIRGGETTTIDLIAIRQNIPVEVVFDQSIVDGFHDGYKVEVKADNNTKLDYIESQTGYFIMPEGCATLSWNFVGTFEYEDGEQVAVDKRGTIENVEPKHAYKLSFKYSKDANGFLGGLTAVLDESIEERNDHLSFSPDPELKGVGFDINSHCNYAGGERKYVATSPADFCDVTIVAGGKEFKPAASSVAGVTLNGLNTPQLYITLSEEFFYSLSGGTHTIELCVIDTSGSEARKDLPYTLPGINSYNESITDLWNGTTSLSAMVFGTPSSVEILYREGEGEWLRFPATAIEGKAYTYTAQITGIGAGHTYEYGLEVGGKKVGANGFFTTEQGNQIPNGDLDTWNEDGKAYYPGASSSNKYWDTGNPGTTTISGGENNITRSSTEVRPDSKGSRSAFLDSKVVLGKFAAGNIFVGSFGEVNIGTMSATVIFGQPFEYNAKPKGVKFWVKYNCGSIDKVGDVGANGDPDLTKIFCCITTSGHTVDSAKVTETTFSPSEENIKDNPNGRYDKVLYYTYFESTTSNTEWHEVYLPFNKVDGVEPTTKGTHLMFTATCSGYGDYFTGSTDSWMYLDDIELVY